MHKDTRLEFGTVTTPEAAGFYCFGEKRTAHPRSVWVILGSHNDVMGGGGGGVYNGVIKWVITP